MPFTPAHAVAARPIRRFLPNLPIAALVAGSIAPDLEFVLHLEARRTVSHQWPGFVTLSLPLGLIALSIWHLALRPGVRVLLPRPLVGLLRAPSSSSSPARPIRAGLLAVIGVLVGTISHLVWDEFTHPGDIGARFFGYSGATAGALQTLSSMVGLCMLAYWVLPHLSELRRHPPSTWFSETQIIAWFAALTTAAVVGPVVITAASLAGNTPRLGHSVVALYLAACYAVAAGLTTAAILPHLLRTGASRTAGIK